MCKIARLRKKQFNETRQCYLQSFDYNIIVKYRTRQIKVTILFLKSFDLSCSILDKDIFSH